MESVRILIFGSPFTDIYRLGERISEYHNLDFLTIESSDFEEYNYFGDNIPATYVDVGDLMSGSASQHYARDPSDWAKMKELDEVYVDLPADPLTDEELLLLEDEDFVVVSSEIPDINLIDWSDVVIILSAKEDYAVDWISKRRKCPCCGAVYHMEDRIPVRRGYCDRCGSHIFQQEKDLPSNIRAQYRVWGKSLWAIEKRVRERGNYIKVSVEKFKTFEDIFRGVDRSLRKILNKPLSVNWNYSLS